MSPDAVEALAHLRARRGGWTARGVALSLGWDRRPLTLYSARVVDTFRAERALAPLVAAGLVAVRTSAEGTRYRAVA